MQKGYYYLKPCDSEVCGKYTSVANPDFELSQEARSFGEGPISLAECCKIIKSLPLNKAPGNDGLPIEFYKTFWNFLWEPLVECFNTSFVKGEMSPSQRQAVITLIEKKDQDR